MNSISDLGGRGALLSPNLAGSEAAQVLVETESEESSFAPPAEPEQSSPPEVTVAPNG